MYIYKRSIQKLSTASKKAPGMGLHGIDVLACIYKQYYLLTYGFIGAPKQSNPDFQLMI